MIFLIEFKLSVWTWGFPRYRDFLGSSYLLLKNFSRLLLLLAQINRQSTAIRWAVKKVSFKVISSRLNYFIFLPSSTPYVNHKISKCILFWTTFWKNIFHWWIQVLLIERIKRIIFSTLHFLITVYCYGIYSKSSMRSVLFSQIRKIETGIKKTIKRRIAGNRLW